MASGKLLELYGGKCVECGYSDPRALQFDHVRGGGRRHRQSVSWSVYYKQIAAAHGTGDFQLLCCNCNFCKRVENDESGKGWKLKEASDYYYNLPRPPPGKGGRRKPDDKPSDDT